MGVAVIIERITEAVAGGVLSVMPDRATTVPVKEMGDLLRPWQEIYPWCARDNCGNVISSKIAGTQHFEPTQRRSRRPLPAPRKLVASHKLLSPDLFKSVRAVWEWYLANGLAKEDLLQAPCNGASLSAFVDDLWTRASDYYGLGMHLEDIGEHTPLTSLECLNLMIPCYSYQDEGGGVVEAFLSGVSGVHSLLEHILGESEGLEIELPRQDLKLIGEIGLQALVQAYHDYDGERTVDLKKLANVEESYFAPVVEKFPKYWEMEFAIIDGDGGWDNDLTITKKEDIDFALAYSEAFAAMDGAIPDPYLMWDNTQEGTAEIFIHEVCEVWRKVHGKRSVKWVSPKQSRLAVRYRKGEL